MPRVPPPCFRSQGKTARTPHTLRVADVVRTYIPQVGYYYLYLFSSFDMLYVCTVCTKKAKAQHGTAAKTMKMKPKTRKGKKIPVPFRVIFFCLIGTPYTRPKRRKEKIAQKSFSLSLVRRPPLSRPPRHRFGPGKAFITLCHSEPRRPPRVKPGAHRGPRSPARQS